MITAICEKAASSSSTPVHLGGCASKLTTNIYSTRVFLDVINYYDKFMAGMKNFRGSLNKILNKDVKFV